MVEPGLDGPGRDPDALGDGVDGQVLPVAEDDHDPLVRVEHLERSTHRIPGVDDVTEVDLALGRPADFIRRQLADWVATARPKAIAAGVDEDAAEPRLEPIGLAQTTSRSPRREGRVGHGVLGFDGVAEDDRRKAEGAVELTLDEAGECVGRIRHAEGPDLGRRQRSWFIHPPLHLTKRRSGTFTTTHSIHPRCRVSSRPMCEHYIARAPEPFRLDELWPFTERLELYVLAGFGWGAAWVTSGVTLESHLDVRAFRDDPVASTVGAVETTSVLVHLRRPSKLSTLQLADTQPVLDPAGRFAFSHNGDLRQIRDARRRFAAEGRIHGRADTEVGARWLEDAWATTSSPAAALRCMHETFHGQANLAVLARDGTSVAYAGNSDNPVYSFRLGRIGIASTALYSIDRSLFQFAAPGATERRVVRPGEAVTLDRNGAAARAS
jgi:hypothetical protein